MKKYECAFCGKEFDIIDERMDCERVCRKTKAEQEKKEREEKLRAEQQGRFSEIQKAINKTDELIRVYCKDYKEGLTFDKHKIIPSFSTSYDCSWKQWLDMMFR